MSGAELAAAAARLVGAPFRLHGRDPATGLDCIGVLSVALASIGRPVCLPNGYRLRTNRYEGLRDLAATCGFGAATLPIVPGDVLIVHCGPCQLHLLVAIDERRFVHAHAQHKRVVISGDRARWPVVGHWRLHAGN